MRINVRPLTLAGAMVISLALASGCGNTETGEGRSSGENGGLRVGMVLDLGGREGNPLNESALRGAQAARDEIGITLEVAEPAAPEDRLRELQRMAEADFDLVIAVGFAFTDAVREVANAHPADRFACIGFDVGEDEGSIPFNVRALLFRDEEGAFLAGAVAGSMTRTGRVGFLGAMDNHSIQRYLAGFRQGVKHVNDRAEVRVGFLGETAAAFYDPARAKEAALGMYDDGVDIIFFVAGPAGSGVIEAAVEREQFVISGQGDQLDAAPGRVVTCVIMHADRAVRESIQAVSEGVFQGGISRMGLLSGGMELLLDERNLGIVPDRVRAQLDGLRRQLMSKRIEIQVKEEKRPTVGRI